MAADCLGGKCLRGAGGNTKNATPATMKEIISYFGKSVNSFRAVNECFLYILIEPYGRDPRSDRKRCGDLLEMITHHRRRTTLQSIHCLCDLCLPTYSRSHCDALCAFLSFDTIITFPLLRPSPSIYTLCLARSESKFTMTMTTSSVCCMWGRPIDNADDWFLGEQRLQLSAGIAQKLLHDDDDGRKECSLCGRIVRGWPRLHNNNTFFVRCCEGHTNDFDILLERNSIYIQIVVIIIIINRVISGGEMRRRKSHFKGELHLNSSVVVMQLILATAEAIRRLFMKRIYHRIDFE